MSASNCQIRHTTPADWEAVSRIFSGPKVVHGTLQLPFPSPEVWRKRLSEPEPGLISLVACQGAEVVGILGVHRQPDFARRAHAAWIGMAVRDDWQGKGVGSALLRAALDLADNWLNLVRVELIVFTDNAPAVRLYQKFGFEIEGTQRKCAFRDGKFIDAYMMSRLRPSTT